MRSVLRRQDGQAVVEYAVLLLLIATGVIALLVVLGGTVGDMFQAVLDAY